ncbi:uncharacterized protein CCDC197 [Stigmatopora nigra]
MNKGRILAIGVNTLQKTLVLKKQAELDQVNHLFMLKRQEFKRNGDELAQKRIELHIKHQEVKDKVLKFEQSLNDNETLRTRTVQQYKAMQTHNLAKQHDLDKLTKLLQQLRIRRCILKERISKYKIFEDFLIKTLDYLPEGHLDVDGERGVTPVIRRHETLRVTHQQLLRRLSGVEQEVERGRRQLRAMKQGHDMHQLMASKELDQLQRQLESLKEENKQAENHLFQEQEQSRKKAEEIGSLILAINNLAEQCYLPAYGPLENMSASLRMDMVKEYLVDKADTERRTRKLMESVSQTMSKTSLTDMKTKASMRNSGSKMQLKSPSKVI